MESDSRQWLCFVDGIVAIWHARDIRTQKNVTLPRVYTVYGLTTPATGFTNHSYCKPNKNGAAEAWSVKRKEHRVCQHQEHAWIDRIRNKTQVFRNFLDTCFSYSLPVPIVSSGRVLFAIEQDHNSRPNTPNLLGSKHTMNMIYWQGIIWIGRWWTFAGNYYVQFPERINCFWFTNRYWCIWHDVPNHAARVFLDHPHAHTRIVNKLISIIIIIRSLANKFTYANTVCWFQLVFFMEQSYLNEVLTRACRDRSIYWCQQHNHWVTSPFFEVAIMNIMHVRDWVAFTIKGKWIFEEMKMKQFFLLMDKVLNQAPSGGK